MIPKEKFELIRSVIQWCASKDDGSPLTDLDLGVWATLYLDAHPAAAPNLDDSLPPYDANSG